MFARTAAAAILSALLIYGVFKALPLVLGPSLQVEVIPGALPGVITISGTASRTETLTLNGGILLIDEQDSFTKTLTLPSGGAILSLTATDRFGRSTYESTSVFVP